MTSTALPRAARSRTSAMISAFEPMSTPPVGSSSTKMSGSALSHLPITTFCWLPPESVRTAASREAVLMRRPSICRSAASRRPGRRHEQPRGQTVENGQGRVRTRPNARESGPGAAGLPAPAPCPWRSRRSGLAICDRRAPDEDLALALAVDAEQDARQRAAAAAEQARDADDFAGIKREIDLHRLARTAEAAQFQQRLAARGAARASHRKSRASDGR